VRQFGLTYSRLSTARQAGVTLDRKVLSDLAIREPAAFEAVVDKAKGRARGLTAVRLGLRAPAKRRAKPAASSARQKARNETYIVPD